MPHSRNLDSPLPQINCPAAFFYSSSRASSSRKSLTIPSGRKSIKSFATLSRYTAASYARAARVQPHVHVYIYIKRSSKAIYILHQYRKITLLFVKLRLPVKAAHAGGTFYDIHLTFNRFFVSARPARISMVKSELLAKIETSRGSSPSFSAIYAKIVILFILDRNLLYIYILCIYRSIAIPIYVSTPGLNTSYKLYARLDVYISNRVNL